VFEELGLPSHQAKCLCTYAEAYLALHQDYYRCKEILTEALEIVKKIQERATEKTISERVAEINSVLMSQSKNTISLCKAFPLMKRIKFGEEEPAGPICKYPSTFR
jgi:hypothetical protein